MLSRIQSDDFLDVWKCLGFNMVLSLNSLKEYIKDDIVKQPCL